MPLYSRALLFTGAFIVPLMTGGVAAADEPLFSHKFHLEEAEAACDDCHDVRAQAQRMPVIKREACLDCHDDTPAFRLAARAQKLKARFPHQRHVEATECQTCHAAITTDSVDAKAPVVARSRCSACHQDNDVEIAEQRCVACHGSDARTERPDDHSGGWLRRHGRESHWRVHETHGSECEACHRTDVCEACHREQPPRDHTALWRVRTHGSAASWDRERCRTCHETGTCKRCHRDTAPTSHRGSWTSLHGRVAGGFTANCTICHQTAWCIACHRTETP